jgi:hypothetical protein
MNRLIFFLLLACSTVMVSCQKEPISTERSPASTEQWILLDQNWTANVTAATITATGAGQVVNGSQLATADLPAAVTTRLQADGVNLINITEAWSTNTGGYIVKVLSGSNVMVYWFQSATNLRSIGKVSV